MNQLKTAIKIFLLMSVITGLIYPLVITLLAQLMLPKQANGSLIKKGDHWMGSTLIAQNTTNENYFWPRPSAINYDPMKPSGGSNLGPTSQKLKEAIANRKHKFGRNAPAGLLYASGSGLDPHISLGTAFFQANRVAKTRSIDLNELRNLIISLSEGKQFGFIGPQYVNVLLLNHILDERYGRR